MPAAALTLSMFVVLTQMHERHAYPALAFLAWGAAEETANRRSDVQDGRVEPARNISTWWIYGVLTLTMLYNIITILPFSDALGPSIVVQDVHSPRWVILKRISFVAAALNIVLLLWLIWNVSGLHRSGVYASSKEARTDIIGRLWKRRLVSREEVR